MMTRRFNQRIQVDNNDQIWQKDSIAQMNTQTLYVPTYILVRTVSVHNRDKYCYDIICNIFCDFFYNLQLIFGAFI